LRTIAEIVECGTLHYTHHYMLTMTGGESCEHSLAPHKVLLTLAKDPSARVVRYGDDTLGIEISGRLWAAESPHSEMRPARQLPHEVWQYCNLALGRNGDTCAQP
jgi:hypothetical protein